MVNYLDRKYIMTKKLILTSCILGSMLFTACGGSGSQKSSTTETAETQGNTLGDQLEDGAGGGSKDDTSSEPKLSEQGQKIVDKAKKENPDAFANQDALKNGGYPECQTNGDIVLVDEGTTCKNSDTAVTASCKDGMVNVMGISGKEVNILRRKFICQ